MQRKIHYYLSAIIALLVCFNTIANARIKLPALVSDHMVLQRNTNVNLWGWATPGRMVRVLFRSSTYESRAGTDGKWAVKIHTSGAGGPDDMTIGDGRDQIIIHDVLTGDVWLCAGQSNMVLDFNNQKLRKLYEQEFENSANAQIRQILVARNYSATPATDFKTNGWKTANPVNLPDFSAAAYFFAVTLYQKFHIPIGLINSSNGGTVAEAWTSEEGLKEFPQFKTGSDFLKDKLPPKYEAKNLPSASYNAMIAPLLPYTIKGIIWYQGEYNTHRAYEYRKLFPALITDWRKHFQQEDLTFIYQQLPNYQPIPLEPMENEWAELREAQLQTLAVPGTAMSVGIDLGGEDLHPVNKKDIGIRLALAAEHLTYKKQKVIASGPVYKSMKIAENKIILQFETYGSQLFCRGDSLRQFAIAGPDKKFIWAKATIRGTTIEVSSPRVTNPIAVRYAWAGNPEGCNLYNTAGLPASPFRTDSWPGLTINN